MATCKDCLLYSMCYVVREVGERDRYAEDCKQFKSKDEYVKIKHGKWLIDNDGMWLETCYTPYCSNCGYKVRLGSIKTPFCPNCGTEMEERRDA